MEITDGKYIEIRERTHTVYERSLLCRRINDKEICQREGFLFENSVQCEIDSNIL